MESAANFSDSQEYQCKFCDQILSTQKLRDNHEFKRHTNPRKKSKLNCDIVLPGTDDEICGKQFGFHNKSGLQKHIMKKHEIDVKNIALIMCDICGQNFRAKEALKKHKERKHIPGKTIPCSQCGESILKLKMAYHKQSKHSEWNYCDLCDFKSKLNITIHKENIHEPKTMPCEFCGKLFAKQYYLNRHMKSQHIPEDEKQFKCTKCGKSFVTNKYLSDHINVHTGEKPYPCHLCETRFQNASNKMAHLKKVHNIKGFGRPYERIKMMLVTE